MSSVDEQPNSQNTQPTWKELTEFISKQSERDRSLVDFWFKMAAAILGIVIVVAGAVITFIGIKTVDDIKRVAEASAEGAAKTKVEEMLKQPAISDFVNATAKEYLSKSGVLRKATEDAVKTQLPPAIQAEISNRLPGQVVKELAQRDLLPRTISAQIAKEFRPRLAPFAGKLNVEIRVDSATEPSQFAKALKGLLDAAGVEAAVLPGTRLAGRLDINCNDHERQCSFADILGELITKTAGREPLIRRDSPSYPNSTRFNQVGVDIGPKGEVR